MDEWNPEILKDFDLAVEKLRNAVKAQMVGGRVEIGQWGIVEYYIGKSNCGGKER